MATIKDIRRRIRSVQSTQQITKAMEMVAAAKLRRAQERSLQTRPYARKMTEILESLAGAAGEQSHPLFEVREVRRRTVVVLSSDKGLCGSFNANVFRTAETELKGWDRSALDIVPAGRRANEYFGRRGWKPDFRLPELGDQLDLARAQRLARHLVSLYQDRRTDRVDLIYTHFMSMASRRVVVERLLPIVPQAAAAGTGPRRPRKEYIFEPSPAGIFDALLPRYIETRVMAAIADSIASEHAARLVSMGAATRNAGDVIAALTLIRNKLRQAAITKEISELVGGAEALR